MSVTYLIDFENVGNGWPAALAGAGPGDVAVLFYSDHSPKALLEQLEKVERLGVRIKFRKCAAGGAGRNGLDFQLASELGYLIGSQGGQDGTYVIVSDDTGYAVLPGYWSAAGVSVRVSGTGSAPGTGGGPLPGAAASVAGWLDGPMTDAGLSRYDRAHVLGCARACMEQLREPGARMERFKSDTLRIKGRKTWERLHEVLGEALSGLFGQS